jgi:hypothetical protein
VILTSIAALVLPWSRRVSPRRLARRAAREVAV